MTIPSMLRAFVAGVALCTAALPASAEPAIDQCLGEDCVVVSADPNGDVSAAADGPCGPEQVSTCAPGAATGTSGRTIRSAGHPVDAWCRWAGSPGTRIDVEGRLTPLPPPRVTVVSMDLTCRLRVNHTTRLTAVGTASPGGYRANGTDTSTTADDHVVVCVHAGVQWSDGTSSTISSAHVVCQTEV